MCNVQTLITNGILRLCDDVDIPEESLTYEYVPLIEFGYVALTAIRHRRRTEHRIFQQLLKSVPHLMERLMECSNEESMQIADLVRPSRTWILHKLHHIYCRFKRVSPTRGRMTLRV